MDKHLILVVGLLAAGFSKMYIGTASSFAMDAFRKNSHFWAGVVLVLTACGLA